MDRFPGTLRSKSYWCRKTYNSLMSDHIGSIVPDIRILRSQLLAKNAFSESFDSLPAVCKPSLSDFFTYGGIWTRMTTDYLYLTPLTVAKSLISS